MIGIGFLIRVVQFLVYFSAACGLVFATVWVVNKGVQLTADALGFEVTDFFVWAKEKFPKRKVRKVCPECESVIRKNFSFCPVCGFELPKQ